jgi:hypothetical protein
MVEYHEGVERRQFENPYLRWPLVVSGAVILVIGLDIWTQKQDILRGLSWTAMGFGMAFYGAALILMRQSSWKWLALAAGLTAWFGGLFGIIRLTL